MTWAMILELSLLGLTIGVLISILRRPKRLRCVECKEPLRKKFCFCPKCGTPQPTGETKFRVISQYYSPERNEYQVQFVNPRFGMLTVAKIPGEQWESSTDKFDCCVRYRLVPMDGPGSMDRRDLIPWTEFKTQQDMQRSVFLGRDSI